MNEIESVLQELRELAAELDVLRVRQKAVEARLAELANDLASFRESAGSVTPADPASRD